jgi:predicted nucleic acid-binding protein
MILPDTTVWIEFFWRNKAFVTEMEVLLQAKKILAFEPVFAELDFGARDNRERELLESYWSTLPNLSCSQDDFLEAATHASENGFLGKGIGLMDALIMHTCKRDNHLLWTLDKRISQHMHSGLLYWP